MPHTHPCGRCGAPDAAFGYGPPHGRTGPTIWACHAHRGAAEQWWRKTYGPDTKRLVENDRL